MPTPSPGPSPDPTSHSTKKPSRDPTVDRRIVFRPVSWTFPRSQPCHILGKEGHFGEMEDAPPATRQRWMPCHPGSVPSQMSLLRTLRTIQRVLLVVSESDYAVVQPAALTDYSLITKADAPTAAHTIYSKIRIGWPIFE